MTEPEIITKDNLFDLDLTADDIKKDNTGRTLITSVLFTKPWWGNPDGGSRFEEVSEGIITDNTRKNVTAVLAETAKALPLKELKFTVELTVQNVRVHADWKVNAAVNSAQYHYSGHI